MTGKKSTKHPKKKTIKQAPQQPLPPVPSGQPPDEGGQNIKKEQPPSAHVVKKILKAETDEAQTLKVVFKSNPDAQMKDFIKKATKPLPQVTKNIAKTPADNHPPLVAQELLDTDDDVADNLTRLFKTSKSYKDL